LWAVAAVAAVAVSVGAAVPVAAAPAPKPTPSSPTLPVPKATVDPREAVGGEKLAGMGVIADLPPGVPAPPKLRNVSWVLADADTGAVIAAKAPHAKLLPASTLKALTALVLIPEVPPTTVVRATPEDANADGTRVGIVPGLDYTAKQLFQALLMASGNDAAYALAEAGGGREATLAAMNQRAAYLGAHDTVAKDPAGLDVPGQTSSAYDLALIGRAALQVPELRGYVATKQVDFPGRVDPKTKKRATYKVNNHNKLLYNYAGTIGLKNGYTEAAHRTFISAVTRGGKTYLLSEMYGLDGSWRPQAAMYDWAFAHGDQATPVGELVDPGTVTTPPELAPTSPPTLTGVVPPAAAHGSPTSPATAAAAALPHLDLLAGRGAPWVGVVSLGVIVLLLLALSAGARRRRHRARH
jgi:D-alanyl-D-alanine carboxypeptidase (penicillin-binding protein 5/6)